MSKVVCKGCNQFKQVDKFDTCFSCYLVKCLNAYQLHVKKGITIPVSFIQSNNTILK